MSPAPKVAQYVAIIMDGNARWAEARGLPVLSGHREGALVLKRTVRQAAELGIKELTAFAFSTENWDRPESEVKGLMELLREMIESQVPELQDAKVRLRFVGRRTSASKELQECMEWGEAITAGNERMTLYVAFSYGGRAEIVDAATRFTGGSEDAFANCLYAPEMHDPDLLIRTSGERRLSNFLLWQCAYSELAFSEKLWPDFGHDDLIAVLQDFEVRNRRFGAR